jgi:hypothetical protein
VWYTKYISDGERAFLAFSREYFWEREFNKKIFVTMNTVLAKLPLPKGTKEDEAFNQIHTWLGSLGHIVAVNEAATFIRTSLLKGDFVDVFDGPGPKQICQDITIYTVWEDNKIRLRKMYG